MSDGPALPAKIRALLRDDPRLALALTAILGPPRAEAPFQETQETPAGDEG